jgi:hypothetical protein
MAKYCISIFEERGSKLLVNIIYPDKPLSIEHYFSEAEKPDWKGTLEKLVAILEVMSDEYVEPARAVQKIDDVRNIVLDDAKIAIAKAEYLANRHP